MSRYRKIQQKMWADEKFAALSPIAPSGQALWVYLLTGPHTGPIPGLFSVTAADLAERLEWTPEAFREAFREVSDFAMAKADWKAKLVFLPNSTKYEKPTSPNVVKSWAAVWEELPECDLKREAYETLKSAMEAAGKAFAEAFQEAIQKPSPKPLRKPSGNQEQEQEQEQENKTPVPAGAGTPPLAAAAPASKAKAKKPETPMPDDFGISPRVEAWAAKQGYGNLPAHLESFRNKCAAKGYRYRDWDAAFMNAISDDWAKVRQPRAAPIASRFDQQKQILDELTGRTRRHDDPHDPFTIDSPARLV